MGDVVHANPILAIYTEKTGDPELSLRRMINEIVRSYRHSWDIFSELLQNSVDAINQRSETDKDFQGRISIEIDPATYSISVADNGVGIPSDKLVQVVAPGESLKTMGKDYGYKGYGLTFVCFVSKTFEIESTKNGKTSKLAIDNSVGWLCNEDALLPAVQISELVATQNESGTRVTVTLNCGSYADDLHPAAALDGMFEWASQAKPLEYVLRTRTAVGNTGRCFDRPPSTEILVNIDLKGSKFSIPYEFLLPSESKYAKQGTYTTPEYSVRWADGSISDDGKRFRALIDKTSGGVGRDEWLDYSAVIIVCGRIGMSNLASDFLIDAVSGLQVTTGYFLALNGMPTGIELSEDPTSGFEQRYFVLVDANLRLSGQLDSGRKGISRYYADLLVRDINKHLVTPVRNAQGETLSGKPTLRTFASMMLDPDNESEADRGMVEKYNSHLRLADLTLELSLKKEPDDENEVIALFTELVGKGVARV